MNNQYLIMCTAFFIGGLIPIQAATNSSFSKSTGSPVFTAFMVFIIGLISISLFIFFKKIPFPGWKVISASPIFSFGGGFIVAAYVIAITYITTKLGVAGTIGCVVTGQIFMAVIIDSLGMFHVTQVPINLNRVIGIILMVMGLYLILRQKSVLN